MSVLKYQATRVLSVYSQPLPPEVSGWFATEQEAKDWGDNMLATYPNIGYYIVNTAYFRN